MINEKPKNIFQPFTVNITSSNIDSYTTDGIYEAYFTNVGTELGTGFGGWGILIVATTDRVSIVEQVIICASGISHRHSTRGVWDSWKKTALS